MNNRWSLYILPLLLAVVLAGLAALLLKTQGMLQGVALSSYQLVAVKDPAPENIANRHYSQLQPGDKVQTFAQASGLNELQEQMRKMHALTQNQMLMQDIQMEVLDAHRQKRALDQELLAQAGLDAESLQQKIDTYDDEDPDAATFTKNIVRRIVMDEVEDFFKKINLATDVGTYVVHKVQNAE